MEPMLQNLQLPQPAEGFIPHRLPMRLIDELLESAGGTATVAATIADGLLTGTDGRLAEAGLVEILAQAFAAMQGYEDSRLGQPIRRGFLVGIRSFRVAGTARAGDRLRVHLRTVGRLGGFALAEGEIRRGEELLAGGTLKLWIPEAEKEQD